ncbi:MAG: transglutaminase family protein [Kiritimatiellia bacterium]
MKMTTARICLKALWTGAWSFLLLMDSAGAEAVASSESVERHVRYGFTLYNTTDQLVPEAELWVCAPLQKTSTQQLLDLDVSPTCEERTDDLGNHLLRFVFSNVPPYAVRVVTIGATLSMRAEPEPMEVQGGRHLKPEPLFEYDNEAFNRLVPEFPAETSPQTVRAIFDWVRGHLQDVGYDGTDRGARYALTQKKGDCTEYATLFVALCRRAGIPARALGGYVAGQNAILDPAAYHNWAEYFLDGRWHMADPQAGAFHAGAKQYVATRILGASDSPMGTYARFRSMGDGIKAVMDK